MPKPKLYQVEKILARRIDEKTNEFEYKVKWVNYPTEEATWEPTTSL
jgi:hypothetical protein